VVGQRPLAEGNAAISEFEAVLTREPLPTAPASLDEELDAVVEDASYTCDGGVES